MHAPKASSLLYIAPYYDPTATAVDEWIRVRPGTDGALARVTSWSARPHRRESPAPDDQRPIAGSQRQRQVPLKASDVLPDGDGKTFMVYDRQAGKAVPDVY